MAFLCESYTKLTGLQRKVNRRIYSEFRQEACLRFGFFCSFLSLQTLIGRQLY
jgi:hypothetical protein